MSEPGLGMPVTYNQGQEVASAVPTTATIDSLPTRWAKMFGKPRSAGQGLLPCAIGCLPVFDDNFHWVAIVSRLTQS